MGTEGPEVVPEAPLMAEGPEIVPEAPIVTEGPEVVPEAQLMTEGPEIAPEAPIITEGPEIVPEAPLITEGPEVAPETPSMTGGADIVLDESPIDVPVLISDSPDGAVTNAPMALDAQAGVTTGTEPEISNFDYTSNMITDTPMAEADTLLGNSADNVMTAAPPMVDNPVQ